MHRGQFGGIEPELVAGRGNAPVILHLPWPPSLNGAFGNSSKGRRATPRYRAWATEAVLVMRAQGPRRIIGPFNVEMTFRRPDRRARDLDNLCKPVLDAIVKAGVIEDDHLSREITLRWSPLSPSERGGVAVAIWEADQ